MAQRLKRCLGIDIGTSAVKIVEVTSEKAGVRINRMVRQELGLPPGPMDAERMAAITRTVRELISQNKIATKQAVFSVAGQSVFIRRIKFPRTSEDRLHRIVAYEARQQIPFALDNSLMEYQVFDYGDSAEVEVLLVAIKKDIITEFMKLVNKVGLKPVMISVSSLALFNFHVFDSTPYNELVELLELARTGETKAEEAKPVPGGKKKGFAFPKFAFGKKKKLDLADVAEAQPVEGVEPESLDFNTDLPEDIYEEVKAYINIGAQTFDLAISRHGRHKMLGFTRSVPWAGNELTRMLSDKLRPAGGAEEAELIKRERAIAVIPGREDEAEAAGIDPHASEFVAQWADRMILEIRKSFDFYIAQPDGMAVDNIVLTGGQAQQRNLSAYIEEKLGIPVDVRIAPENGAVTFGEGASPDEMVSYVIATGLALSGVGLGQVTVDFLPTELKTIREFKKKNLEIFALLALLLLIIGVSYFAGGKEMENMNNWLATNRPKLETVNRTKAALDKARADRTAVSDQVTALGQSLGDRTFWLEFMGMLEGVKPSTILLTSIDMNPDGTVNLIGETAENVGAIANFSKELGEQKEWVKKCEINIPPQERFSRMINRPVTQFGLHIETQWKRTRLAPARVTLAPGQYTPAATPTPAAGIQQGGPGVPGNEGAI
jgi:Tfp pilus assembly PilM family ATPase